jgi:vesicle-associated membrane protein 7
MPIFYTLIARDGHILTEATSRTVEAGNFQQIALQILSKIGQESEGAKRSFSTGGYVFNIQINDGVVYLCLVDLSFQMRMSFSFLAEVINRFTTTYTRMAVRQAITGQMKDFDRTLQQLMEHFSNPSADKIHRAKQEIESVKQVMLTNIDLVLKRNADIEELSMRTEQLDDSSSSYRMQTQAVKKKMVWKNRKWAAILGCCCVLLAVLGIYIVISLICGWTFSSCS